MTPGKIMLIFGVFCTIFIAILPHVIWLIGWLVSLLAGHNLRYAPFGWTALGCALAVVILLSYGFFIGRWQLEVKDIEYRNKNIPAAFDGLRIVHISDLHLSTFNDRPDRLEQFVEKINGQSPDIICFTGDLVTMGREEAEPYTETLKELSAGYGVFSVLGNHDFLIYERSFKTDAQRIAAVNDLVDYESNALGWRLLRNGNVRIEKGGDAMTIIGVDNRNCSNHGFKTIDCGDLRKAMSDAEGFRILLSHDPIHWDAEVLPETDIPLTLSGHTHAAQISLFGWTPASMMFPRAYGRYDDNGQTLYVNPGLGCTAPFRIGARPEITVITLKSGE